MDEEQIKKIIRNEIELSKSEFHSIIKDELKNLILSDKYLFSKLIQILDGRNIQTGRTTGTKIGTATDQKIGFYGTTPITQGATVSDANAQGGTYSQTDVQSIANAVNTLIDRLQAIGIIA